MGYGDILRNPTAQMKSSDRQKDMYNIEAERSDQLRACAVSFKFVVFKTSIHANPQTLPKRIFLQTRFFTFPEVHTDAVSLIEPGIGRDLQIIRPGGTYYLGKDRMVELGHGRVER